MAITAEARVVVRGGSQALKELQGVSRKTTEASRASQKAAKEEQKAARENAKAQVAVQKAAENAKRAQTREAQKAAREEMRVAKQAADYTARIYQRSLDMRMRMEKDATRNAQREAAKRVQIEQQAASKRDRLNQDNARRGRGFMGAVAGGVVAGASVAANTARSVGGIRSVQERIQAANEFRERLTITGTQANLSAEERAKVEGQVNAASAASGKDQNELVGVLETGQAQFNDLRFFADHLTEIATIARASGSDTEEFAKALGYAKQAFGLTGEEAMQAARMMVAAASKGSIEVKDFATSFAPVMGLFAENLGQKSLAGFAQLLGTAQAVGTLGKGADASGTLVERLVASLGDSDVKTKLKTKAGIDIKGKSMAQIIEAMATSKNFQKASVREDIFGKGDILTNQAITALLAARQRRVDGKAGAVDIESIAAVKAADGAALTSKTMTELEGSGALAFDRQNAELQARTLANLSSYNSQLLKVNEMSMRLETSFGTLGLWADAIAATGVGAAVGGAVAGGGGGGGGGGAILQTLGKAVSILGPLGAILGGGAAIAGALYEAGAGEWIVDQFSSPIEGATYTTAKGGSGRTLQTGPATAPGLSPRPSTPAGAQPTRLLEQHGTQLAEQTKLLKQVVANTANRPPPVIDNGARSPR